MDIFATWLPRATPGDSYRTIWLIGFLGAILCSATSAKLLYPLDVHLRISIPYPSSQFHLLTLQVEDACKRYLIFELSS
jgi:hypothetical protein